jgi:hypothetical protein
MKCATYKLISFCLCYRIYRFIYGKLCDNTTELYCKISSSASTEEVSLNIWPEFNPVLAQSRWLRTSTVLVNPRTGTMQASFRSLIRSCHYAYICQKYCNRSLGRRSVLWTLHCASLPESSARMTSVDFFFNFTRRRSNFGWNNLPKCRNFRTS